MVRETRKKAIIHEAVVPLRAFLFRLSIVFFIFCSIGLLVLSRFGNPVAKQISSGVIDFVVPSLSVLSSPVETLQNGKEKAHQYVFVFGENKKLREENESLKRLKNVAVALEAENQRLRELLNMIPQEKDSFLTARVVADTGGAYTRSVLINQGGDGLIKEGQMVTNQSGLVGRVVEVGKQSARVILLTDINSRVPVVTEKSRERAVLAGNNSPYPQLNHLPDNSNLRVGERVVTSGDGEYYPSGVAVGEIYKFSDGIVQVKPLVDWSRLDFVTIAKR